RVRRTSLFPYTTLFRSDGFDGSGVLPCAVSPSGEPSYVGDRWSVVHWPLSLRRTSAERVGQAHVHHRKHEHPSSGKDDPGQPETDRKSTRLNSSHVAIS